jgi:hypothetical protein
MGKKLRTYIKIAKGLSKPVAGFIINTKEKLSRRDGFVELETNCCGDVIFTTSTTTTTTTAAPTTSTTTTTTTV